MNTEEIAENGAEVDVQDDKTPEKSNKQKSVSPKSGENKKFVRLPLARVKNMMKADQDCGLLSQDAVFLVTKATELFLEFIAKETVKQTLASSRKTIMRRDVDAMIDKIAHLCFLDGAMD